MKQNIDLNKRSFLRGAGVLGAAAVFSGSLNGCGAKGSGKQATEDFAQEALGEVPTEGMQYRHFDNLEGVNASLLGYGCMRWPWLTNEKGENVALDQEEINALVDYAIAHGVNYFDTAPKYLKGLSEEATGIALARYPRESFYLATKLSNYAKDDSLQEGKDMLARSLKRLQTNYIDFLLCHNIATSESFSRRFIDNGLLDWLCEQRAKGVIRHLGFSFHGDVMAWRLLMSYHSKVHWDFVQIQMNYVDWEHPSEESMTSRRLYEDLAFRNIPVVIMEPLLGGGLSTLPEFLANKLKSQRPDKSLASWAFRFCGSFPQVLTVLSGMTYMDHLQDNLRTYNNFEPLTEDEFKFLDEAAKIYSSYPTVPCTACKYCMPCPYGLDIPGIFAHYNKCVNTGQVVSSKADEGYAKARKAFLVGYDRAVPSVRQAAHCITCGLCRTKCPQRINIPKRMQEIDAFVEKLKQGLEL